MKKQINKTLRLIVTFVTIAFFTCSLSAQDAADGAASGTTGGQGGQTVTVNSLSSLKSYAESSTKYIILVSGTISSSNNYEIHLNSNKTIVGLGSNAALKNIELNIDNKSNIIIRNLTIKDSYVEGDWEGKTQDYDGIQADHCSNIWIDHCHFTHLGDGCVDLREATDNVTVSWCRFSNHNKAFGIGWTDDTGWEMTIHHNWFDGTGQRNPSFDQGKGHLYNNYLNDIGSYGNLARGNAKVIVENSRFENVHDPLKTSDNGKLYSSGNSLSGCSGSQSGNTSSKPWTPGYSYSLDGVSNVKSIVTSGAGPKSSISDQYTNPQPTLSVSPTSVSVAAAAGSTGSFNVTSNTSWTVSDNQSWLTVSPSSGSNNGTVTVTAAENTSTSTRSATVTVAASGVSSKTVSVMQAAGIGSKIISAYSTIQAEDYSSMSGIQTESCSEGGLNVGFINNGDWIAFNDVEFGSGAAGFAARVASNTSGGTIEVRLNSVSGTLIGTCSVSNTGGWQTWTNANCNISGASGKQNLYLVFKGGSGYLFNFNNFVFTKASSGGTINNGSYSIIAKHSGKGMEVAGSSVENGANVQQWAYSAQTNQQWNITSVGDGYYKIENVNSDRALDVKDASIENAANMQQWGYGSGSANKQFRFEDMGDGYYRIRARNSDKCIDVASSSSNDGANIQQYTCHNNDNQRWQLNYLGGLKSATVITENSSNSDLKLFPNPAANLLNISASGVDKDVSKITIYNSLGKLVYSSNTMENNTTVDISNLTSGIYMLSFTNGSGVVIRKFLKE